MRVLVIGASGFLGTSVVAALAGAGVEVRGMVRSPAAAGTVRRSGGRDVTGDVLDLPSIVSASTECDAIVHLATEGDLGRAERVRVEGARNVVLAARANGVRRILIGSGYWVYASQPGPIDERSPVEPRGESKINYEAERVGLEASALDELDVLVARPGMVYGDGAWFRPMVEEIRAGRYRVIGDGRNQWSFVSWRDCGTAFVEILRRGTSGEVYNVVDGHPAPWGEFTSFVADQVGAPRPPKITFQDGRIEHGPDVAHHLVANRALGCAKLSSLGWHPRDREYRTALPALLATMDPPRSE